MVHPERDQLTLLMLMGTAHPATPHTSIEDILYAGLCQGYTFSEVNKNLSQGSIAKELGRGMG